MNELRETADGGIKKDEEKPRLDLIPILSLIAVGDVFKSGAIKYADRNWEQGLDFHRVYRAAIGHLMAWWNGENEDDEWGYSHLDHALCCVLMLSEYMKRYEKFQSFDDRPYRSDNADRADSTDQGTSSMEISGGLPSRPQPHVGG